MIRDFHILKILNSGYAILIAAIMAIINGLYFPEYAKLLAPYSSLFITLLSISIIPIVFSSITASIITILTNQFTGIKISRLFMALSGALIIAAILGIFISYISDAAKHVLESETISNLIFQDAQNSVSQVLLTDRLNSLQHVTFSDFISTLFPSNPFKAFADGNIVQIISVSILVGVAIAGLSKSTRDTAVGGMTQIMNAFKEVLKIPTKILPLGMFCLISSNISKVRFEDLMSMKVFCFAVIAGFGLLLLIAFILFTIYSPVNIKQTIAGIKKPFVIAFSTCSNQATLPFLISALRSNLKLPRDIVEFAIPLEVILCRTGNVLYYAFVAVFVSIVYNEPLEFYQLIFVVFSAILTSFAASGASGVISITMISIILDPLNLPIESILLVLIIIDPLLDPFRTVTSLIMNSAISCFIVNKERKKLS